MKAFIGTMRKNYKTLLRAYPVSFFVGNLLTAFYTNLSTYFLYHYLFRGKLSEQFFYYTQTSDYMSYAIIGTILYVFVVRTCLNVSRTLITELREGTLESIMLAPFKRGAYLGANMCLQTITTIGESIITIIIGMPFGLHVTFSNFVYFCIAMFVSLLGFFGLSIVLGSIMLYTRDTYISQNTLFSIIFLVCGITFPVEYLPSAIQLIGKLLPVTYAVEAIRMTLVGSLQIHEYWMTIEKLTIISALYFIIGFYTMSYVERIAIEKMEV